MTDVDAYNAALEDAAAIADGHPDSVRILFEESCDDPHCLRCYERAIAFAIRSRRKTPATPPPAEEPQPVAREEVIRLITWLRRKGQLSHAETVRRLFGPAHPPAPGSVPAGMPWQPIETAPKDGTPVDLWCRAPGLSAGPSRVPDCWYSDSHWWRYDDQHGDDQCRSRVHNATHWMRPSGPSSEPGT